MGNIREWLESLGLGQYADAFERNDVDSELLPDLADEDLEKLGIGSLGHRKKLLKAISSLASQGPSRPDSGSVSESNNFERGHVGQAERRQLTVMFADLVGSTELSQTLEAEDLREINLAYQSAATTAIEQCGGYVARYMGDGVLAYFGFPQAHEDDAGRALRAGLMLTSVVPKLSACITLAVRVGIATGPVVVGDIIGEGLAQESAVVGETPNLAARLQGEAEPNSVVISEATEALTRGSFEIESLPARALKGFAHEVAPYRVHGEVRGQSRFAARSGTHLSPFVGREEELELLARRWATAREGEGQVVVLVGDAGIGKSRLLEQLRKDIEAEPHQSMVLQCSSHRENSTLWPIIRSFEQALGYAELSATKARLASLQKHLEDMAWYDEVALGLLANLLSVPTDGRFLTVEAMAAREIRESTLRTLVEYVRRRALVSPMLWAVEDLHWADASTQEFLARLVADIEGERVLILCTTRPKLGASWTQGADVSVLSLARLTRANSARLVRAASRLSTQLSNEDVNTIVDRATGNPLFIEELTRMAASPGSGQAIANTTIPATLQDFLMERLDTLSYGKLVAQRGAVVGREFSRALLEIVWDHTDEELESGLRELEQSGLVSKLAEGKNPRYAFKHALIRDASYHSMLRRARQRVHGQIGASLESVPGLANSQPELLAYHYGEAGLRQPAIKYLYQAGEKSALLCANTEAIAHLDMALASLKAQPEGLEREQQELDAQLLLGAVHQTKTGWGAPEAEQAFFRAKSLSQKLETNDPKRRFLLAGGLRRVHNHKGRIRDADQAARECLRIAERTGAPEMLRDARYAVGFTHAQRGEFRLALEQFKLGAQSEHIHTRAGRTPWLSGAASNHAGATIMLWYLGYPDQAQCWCTRLVEFSASSTDPFFKSYYLTVAGFLALRLRDFETLVVRATTAKEIAGANHLSLIEGWATVLLGWSQVMNGGTTNGLEFMNNGNAMVRRSGSFSYHTWLQTLMAEAYDHAGNVEAGLESIAEAIRYETQTGMRESAAETRRVKGLLLERAESRNCSSAEGLYREAIKIARLQEAKSLELKSSISLCRLLAETDRAVSALEIIDNICGQYTEGFDTADLADARKLQEDLR